MISAGIKGGNAARKFTVPRGSDNLTLQKFLAQEMKLSLRGAKSLVDSRSVWINAKCVWMAHHTIHAGDVVEISRGALKAVALKNVKASGTSHIRVLVENENYLVADKPAGVLSCGAARSAEDILRKQLASPQLQAVHRLDRDTSGCLLFAKSREAFERAVEMFKLHRVVKIYHAIAAGRVPWRKYRIDSELDSKNAVTNVSTEALSPDASFLRLKIDTGRTNQIRRHLASIRFPIAGDRVFGLKSPRDERLRTIPRLMLHASGLSLPDPFGGKCEIKAHSPLPADFRSALRLFGMGAK